MKLFLLIISFLFISAEGSLFAQVPEWAKGVVWYQVFPERFANGDRTNDPEPEKVFINADSIPKDGRLKTGHQTGFRRMSGK